DPTFRTLIGDYSALPRRYLTDDYLKASASCRVEGIVWYEFLSADPGGEARWAQRLADASRLGQSMVGLVDFLDPALEERLEAYAALPNLVAVREHLGWDTGNALRRFAKRPDLLTDPAWRQGVGALRRFSFRCGLEVFAPQLSDLHDVVRLHPEIGFTLAVMGWPLDLSPAGYTRWRHDLAVLSRCANVRAEIAAIECIFGMGWHREQIAPWVLSIIEMFGPGRCMFGSHMPIAGLSWGFERLYDAYQEIVAGFSSAERDDMFRGTAAAWFKLR
ncbi:MAG TPA: amidohydrolase family protein, partial [Myxococcales bacterium]|nr:amidohydrolase family protein [Myxococcales bacterium]